MTGRHERPRPPRTPRHAGLATDLRPSLDAFWILIVAAILVGLTAGTYGALTNQPTRRGLLPPVTVLDAAPPAAPSAARPPATPRVGTVGKQPTTTRPDRDRGVAVNITTPAPRGRPQRPGGGLGLGGDTPAGTTPASTVTPPSSTTTTLPPAPSVPPTSRGTDDGPPPSTIPTTTPPPPDTTTVTAEGEVRP